MRPSVLLNCLIPDACDSARRPQCLSGFAAVSLGYGTPTLQLGLAVVRPFPAAFK